MTETDFLKCLGQYHNDKHILAKERMSVAQILLARISLRYYQVIWSGPGAETLEQALSASYISNIENGTQEWVAWLETLSKTDISIEWLATAL